MCDTAVTKLRFEALLLPASGQFDEILTKDRRQQAPLIYDGGLDALDFVVSTR